MIAHIRKCRYFFVVSLFCSLLGMKLQAQELKGRITDINGNPVEAASLYIKELKQGTSANDNGSYELKMPEGTYTCIFQCLGYETQTHSVIIGKSTVELDIFLKEKAYEIAEVIISNKNEDPAYDIMRRAIAMAPYYLNQVSEYKAEVYLKGSLQVDKISGLVKRLAGDQLKEIKEGNTYLEETYNEIEFTAPNKYRQKVLKKTGNIPNQDENSGSIMELVTVSVYDPKAILPNISPLSSSAFTHYKFRYEGFIEEDNRIINRIKIIPRHKGKQVISGYIYIADSYWNVYRVDVTGQFPIGGDYRVQIYFNEVNDNIWLPVTHRIDFNGSILGNKGVFRYNSSVKYHHVEESTSIKKPDVLLQAEQQRKAVQNSDAYLAEAEITNKAAGKVNKEIREILEKDDLSNREAYKLARLMQKETGTKEKKKESLNLSETYYDDYKVEMDSAANKRDTVPWDMIRPVPLMPNELKSYQEKATLKIPLSNDTLARKNKPAKNIFQTGGKILWGTDIHLGKAGTLGYRGLRSSKLGFNTVDGFYIGLRLPYYKDFGKSPMENRLSITPEVIWAINRKKVMWEVKSDLSYAPLRRGNLSVIVGHKSTDFNGLLGMLPLKNTISSLFFRRNYMKLYDQEFAHVNNRIDIANGLQLDMTLLYSKRRMLENHSDYSFFYQDSREYTSNEPKNNELTLPLTHHTNTSFNLHVNYTPRFFYRIDRANRKRMVRSDFPTFYAGWRKGLKDVLNSDSDFDLLYGGIAQTIETGIMQHFKYVVGAGTFVNRKNIYFPDYVHFRTAEIPIVINQIGDKTFNLLEYYRFSTSDKYLEAHAYFSTPYLMLKYLPFFRDRLWSEGLQVNYLYTPEIKNYMEIGYTIGLIWHVGFFVGFENFEYRSMGVRLTLPIGLFN
ncbi:MAG: DUF5686 and carboxypeptidase regulatory-like domain-containing protein [Bacteroidales bacterium]|jgi:hypothetical protein|nr:DUF5686 and carboxypeptidase regulatory-like domain-containing protein [Bacteroidales bacterium]